MKECQENPLVELSKNKEDRKIDRLKNEGVALDPEDFQEKLVAWFDQNGRDLPWRRLRNPYTVWVSEIMLQQTQVRSVVDYFVRFVEQFPTVEALAGAPLQDVLKAWEGLGYYSRARNLHKAARLVVEKYGGRLPNKKSAILKLPGIGRYTAGAILSLAFGAREPVLDGNVGRVLSRVFFLEEPIETSHAKERLWHLADALLPAKEAGKFNEALMELGAVVCTPREPACGACPVREMCGAFARGKQNELPLRKPRKKVPHYDVAAGVIWNAGKILVTLRPTDKMLGGLWEFPGGKCEQGESLEACLRREIREELGLEIRVREPFLKVRHAYSHFKITLHMFHCDFLGGEPVLNGVDAFRWVQRRELLELPFPAADGRVIQKILAESTDSTD